MCKYECVRRAAKRLNFREVADDEDWNIYWTDTSVGVERVSQMNKWQVSFTSHLFFSLIFCFLFSLKENQSFSRDERNLSKRFVNEKYDTNAKNVS